VLVARPLGLQESASPVSVSVVIPCRNEKENIAAIVSRMPEMGRWTELIFSDDRSTDGTADEVRRLMALYPHKRIKLVDGPGICKSKNVWNGFEHATGDIFMIFDADSTVIPEELPYFYEALIDGKGDFINGSRLVYPMAEDAMPFHKMVGNKMFSLLFSYILGQRVKDTLCGTKVFWRDDYERMKSYFGAWGPQDRWGDYDLLFSASKLNLKIVDLPVHYFERLHGTTKMSSVITNGIRMMAMVLVAFKKLRFF
jgi:glycosyltransferase involved in cell wall biosynthesis